MEDKRSVVKPEASRLLSIINRTLTKDGIQAYLVGGFVRDTLLGRDTDDIDIVVDDVDAMIIASRIADILNGTYVPLDEVNRIARIVMTNTGWQIDFTTLNGDIRHDLAQRDFTIDAMAIPLDEVDSSIFNPGEIIDPFHGSEDLRHGMVRAVSDAIFTSDAARLIRAVRIAAELGFSIDSNTEQLIHRDSHLINRVAGERVREEFLRLLAIPGAGPRLAYLDKLGLLTAIMPELVPTRGVEQPWIHVWDVLEHSIQTVTAAEFVLRESTWDYIEEDILAIVPWSTKLNRHFDQEISKGSTRRSLLKIAALLHDIAKPQTKSIDPDGRARFLGHPVEGAVTATDIMERLRFSRREIQLVELLVKYHMRPLQMSNQNLPTRRALYRYFRDTGETGIDILFLCLADHLATRGPNLDIRQWREHARITDYMLKYHFEEKELSAPPKLIDGHDIINIFKLKPGPRIGELLEGVREAQTVGEIKTRQQAIDYIGKTLSSQVQNSRNEQSQGES